MNCDLMDKAMFHTMQEAVHPFFVKLLLLFFLISAVFKPTEMFHFSLQE